jgi:hypothetical protein
MHKGIRVKHPYSCQTLMKLEFSRQIFKKSSNIKLYEKPSSGSELFHADGGTDMTKLTVAFRKFANALKRPYLSSQKNI